MTPPTARPNLFIVGAMKSGTTTLHNLLARHPDIYMSAQPKEPGYFNRPDRSAAETAWYESLFGAGAERRYRGESSTDYSKLPMYPGCAERIRAYAPEARILYIMRDPWQRAISHYWWQVEWSAEGRPLAEVLQASTEILDVGDYARQLAPYWQHFGRERVRVLTLEELEKAPEAELARVFEWLGLDAAPAATLELRADNAGQAMVQQVAGARYLARLKGGPVWALLKRGLSPRARVQLQRLLSRRRERRLDDDDLQAARRLAHPVLAAQIQALEQQLGRSFPAWPSAS